MSTYVEDLFTYLHRYETNPPEFDAEAFVQTYNGVLAVFQALREQREKAVEVDTYFLQKIKSTPLTTSDLRLFTVQILVTFFEAEADIDGHANQAYLYCRSLRKHRQDIPYFENELLPMLVRDGSLNWSTRLNSLFLQEIARYMNTHGRPLAQHVSPEEFNALTNPSKLLLLARRRLQLGSDLLRDRSSLEFHLHRINAIRKLALQGPVYRDHLTAWQYLPTTSLWARLRNRLRELYGKLTGAVSNLRYLRLLLLQRQPAYWLLVGIILVSLAAAVLVPSWWNRRAAERLDKLTQHSYELQTLSGK